MIREVTLWPKSLSFKQNKLIKMCSHHWRRVQDNNTNAESACSKTGKVFHSLWRVLIYSACRSFSFSQYIINFIQPWYGAASYGEKKLWCKFHEKRFKVYVHNAIIIINEIKVVQIVKKNIQLAGGESFSLIENPYETTKWYPLVSRLIWKTTQVTWVVTFSFNFNWSTFKIHFDIYGLLQIKSP